MSETRYSAERRTLRQAATLLRRLDTFCDGKLEEEGVPARVIAGDLLQLSNDLTMFEAMARVRGMHEADQHSVRVDSSLEREGETVRSLRVLEGGA